MRETPRRAGLRPSAELGDPQPIARPDVILALEAVPAEHVGDPQPVQLGDRTHPLLRPDDVDLLRGPPAAGRPCGPTPGRPRPEHPPPGAAGEAGAPPRAPP